MNKNAVDTKWPLTKLLTDPEIIIQVTFLKIRLNQNRFYIISSLHIRGICLDIVSACKKIQSKNNNQTIKTIYVET